MFCHKILNTFSNCIIVRPKDNEETTELLVQAILHFTIRLLVSLTTGPKPPPKRVLHIVPSRVSLFRCEYPLLSLRSSGSFLLLLPRLTVTSNRPFIFPSITCLRRQFLRKI
jgi:hypothetical protein